MFSTWRNDVYNIDKDHNCKKNEAEHCSSLGCQNPRCVILTKSESKGKLDNVDAYFVDMLNKSMAENENHLVLKQSTEHIYAEPMKLKPETKIINTSVMNHENELRSKVYNCHSSPSDLKKSNGLSNGTTRTINGVPYNGRRSSENSSSGSSSFVSFGGIVSEKQNGVFHERKPVRSRPYRSSSTCSVPEFAALTSFCFNNSESMPNIASSANYVKLLAASQLSSSISLTESDNMSEQSGYVSSRKSSGGSTTQISPAGE